MSQTAPSARTLSRYGLLIALVGAAVQLVLGVYYLYMAHAPQPHDLPVGIVASAQQREQLTQQLEAKGEFEVAAYTSPSALTTAIKSREAYGGVVFERNIPTLYVASAAAPAVANLLRSSFQAAYSDQVAEDVSAATASGKPVPAATLATLTRPPAIEDVVPLPPADRSGSSLGFLIQALCLGGSIASLAIGRIGRLTQLSVARGIRHTSLLVAYALISAGVVLLAMRLFDVGVGADMFRLFWGFALLSLAVTASTAGAVALVGPAGALLGGLYFTLGLVISGTSIAPEMLPSAGRHVGQLLPPGAGATVVRDALYFPSASTAGPFIVLGVIALAGLAVVLVKNTLANFSSKDATPA